MKLRQTQFALSKLSPNGSYKDLIIFSFLIIAGTVLFIYFKNVENRKMKTT